MMKQKNKVHLVTREIVHVSQHTYDIEILWLFCKNAMGKATECMIDISNKIRSSNEDMPAKPKCYATPESSDAWTQVEQEHYIIKRKKWRQCELYRCKMLYALRKTQRIHEALS